MSIFVSIRRCPNISNKTLEIYFSNLLHDLKLITRSKGHVTLFGSSSRYVTTLPSLVNLDVDSADNFNLSRDLAKPFFLFQMVMCFCESNSLTKGCHAAKFGDFRHCDSEDINFLICQILCVQVWNQNFSRTGVDSSKWGH